MHIHFGDGRQNFVIMKSKDHESVFLIRQAVWGVPLSR